MLAGSINDDRLLQITSAGKVAGSAVQISPASALENDSGLSLKATIAGAGLNITDNAANQIMSLAPNGVGLNEMAGIVRGKFIVGDASGNPAYLAAGAAGKLLTANNDGDPSWATVVGDVSLTGAGTITIGDNKVDADMINVDVVTQLANRANGGLAAQGDNLELDMNDLAAQAVNVGSDSIAFIDSDGNGTKKGSIADLVAAMVAPGGGLSASGGKLSTTAQGGVTLLADAGTVGEGYNYFADLVGAANATVTLPANPSEADKFVVKAGNIGTGWIKIKEGASGQDIDGQDQVLLESPYASVTLIAMTSGNTAKFRIV
jgi:hypothetical protein